MNVFVLRMPVDQWPARCVAVILADDRLSAIDRAEDLCEEMDTTLEKSGFEIGEVHEAENIEDLYLI